MTKTADDIVAFGELLIDFAPHSINEGDNLFFPSIPAVLNIYGCTIAMIGKVGKDLLTSC